MDSIKLIHTSTVISLSYLVTLYTSYVIRRVIGKGNVWGRGTGRSFGRSSPRAHAATQSRATTWRCGSRESRLIPVSQLRGSRPHPHLLQRRRPHLAVGHGRSNPRASMDVYLTPPCFTARFAIGCSPLTNPHPPRLQLPHVSCFCLAADEPGGDGRHGRLLQNRRTPSCCNRLKKSFIPLDEKLQPDVEKATSDQRHRRKATTVDMKCYNL